MSGSSTFAAPVFDEVDARIEQELDITGHNQNSIYNVTGYKPVKTELTHVPVRVTGQIPADLQGVYLRNGTNTQFDVTHVRKIHSSGCLVLHFPSLTKIAAGLFLSGSAATQIRTMDFLQKR
jgi:hypothetical protein